MSGEVKIVIALKDNKGSIGVQSPDCDPIFTTFEGGLEQALGSVPVLVEDANRRWDENPHYPKCKSPLPSESAPTSRTATSQPTRQASTTEQPSMF